MTPGRFAPIVSATAWSRVHLSGQFTQDTLLVAGATRPLAVLGKALGVVLGARLTDLTRGGTIRLTIGLNARGAMELVVAAFGVARGSLTPTS